MKRLTDYEFATTMLLEFVDSGLNSIAPCGAYDDDADFLGRVMDKVGESSVKKFTARVFRVCWKLAQCGAMYGRMYGTQKEYLGEPTKQMEYAWANPSYPWRLAPPEAQKRFYGTPAQELAFILRNFPGAPER